MAPSTAPSKSSTVRRLFSKMAPSSKKPSGPTPAQALAAQTRANAEQQLAPVKKDHEEAVERLADEEAAEQAAGKTEPEQVAVVPQPISKPKIDLPPRPQIASGPSTQAKIDPNLAIWLMNKESALYPSRSVSASHYLVNTLSPFATLDQAHRLMRGNERVWKLYPEYLPFAVNVYIQLMVHIRVTHIRMKLGLSSDKATQFLTRMNKAGINPEDLPIPTLLKPYFESLAACKPKDERVGLVVPFYPDNLGGSPTTDIDSLVLTGAHRSGNQPITNMNGLEFLRSNACLPAMLDILRYFVNANFDAKVATAYKDNKRDADRAHGADDTLVLKHNQDGLFVPLIRGASPLEDTKNRQVILAGRTISLEAGAATDANAQFFMSGLGCDSPAIFDFDRLRTVQKYWKGSHYDVTGPQLTASDSDLSTPQTYARCDENFSWIRDLESNIQVFCSFMGGSFPMGSLPISGNPIALNQVKVYVNGIGTRPRHRRTDPLWCTPMWNTFEVSTEVYEEEMPDRFVLSAQWLMPCAEIELLTRNATGNATALTALTKNSGGRIGPYFTNQINSSINGFDTSKTYATLQSQSDRKVTLDRLSEMIKTYFYDPRPE